MIPRWVPHLILAAVEAKVHERRLTTSTQGEAINSGRTRALKTTTTPAVTNPSHTIVEFTKDGNSI